jgi:hypothetical protein
MTTPQLRVLENPVNSTPDTHDKDTTPPRRTKTLLQSTKAVNYFILFSQNAVRKIYL